jgi:hypothetical protein
VVLERASSLAGNDSDRVVNGAVQLPAGVGAAPLAHANMRSLSTKGSSYANFQRSLQTRKLSIVLPAAAELAWINLVDSLEILTLMAQEGDPRFERAAARWVGRLLTETPPMTLREARWVVAMVEQLPRCRESLHRLASRR